MKATGTREERETIIQFNEIDENVSIWTASDVVYRQLLKRLGREALAEDGERHATFVCPKSSLILPRTKAKRVLTPAQRLKLAANLARTPKN